MIPEDTIAAIATPIGQAGIGIIRISGESAITMADRLFRPGKGSPATSKGSSISGFPSHTVHFGVAVDPVTLEPIDEILLTVFRAPRSYTGEDVVELSCHGGTATVRSMLEAAITAGARHAEPGEFTKRAFLNGRMDLAQAEAVNDLIRARTDEARKLALRQLEGDLSQEIKIISSGVTEALAAVEASIDFPEDVDEPQAEDLQIRIAGLSDRLRRLLATADRGRIYREGISVAIAGKPNVGKSSLLNALLRESRAIVTPVPGTTRDTIEETISIKGIPVVAIDTAGLRETQDEVEQIGVRRAEAAVEMAQVVLLVVDAREGMKDEDLLLYQTAGNKTILTVLNKADLSTPEETNRLAAATSAEVGGKAIATSAFTGAGIVELEDAIAEVVLAGAFEGSASILVSNLRHKKAVEQALESLDHAANTAKEEQPVDMVSVDLMAARNALDRITGETASEDLIDRIFSDFCIGK